MSDIEFSCPFCEHDLVVDTRASGASIDCPECGREIRIPRVQQGRTGIQPGGAVSVFLQELPGKLEGMQTLVDQVDHSMDALVKSFSRQNHELDTLGHQAHQLKDRADGIVHQVKNQWKRMPLVGDESFGSQTGSAPLRSSDMTPLGLWKGLAFGFGALSILALCFAGWVTLANPGQSGGRGMLDVAGTAGVIQPPATTTLPRAVLTWETSALPSTGDENVLLQVIIRNPSLTQDLLLRHLSTDSRVIARDGTRLPHRVTSTVEGQEAIAPGGEGQIRFWVAPDQAGLAERLIWLPGLWVESGQGDLKERVFQAPLDVSLNPRKETTPPSTS